MKIDHGAIAMIEATLRGADDVHVFAGGTRSRVNPALLQELCRAAREGLWAREVAQAKEKP